MESILGRYSVPKLYSSFIVLCYSRTPNCVIDVQIILCETLNYVIRNLQIMLCNFFKFCYAKSPNYVMRNPKLCYEKSPNYVMQNPKLCCVKCPNYVVRNPKFYYADSLISIVRTTLAPFA